MGAQLYVEKCVARLCPPPEIFEVIIAARGSSVLFVVAASGALGLEREAL